VTWISEFKDFEMQFSPSHQRTLIKSSFPSRLKPKFHLLPGSRANLVLYKLRRDLRLSKAFNPSTGSWQFLKFRHLRSLADNPLLNRDNLDQLFQLDPHADAQLRLI
jgi:hypothetical protein